MGVAFHRGLTHELKLRMQQAGVRIEEIDAQRALAGLLTRETDMRGNAVKSPENARAIRSSAAQILERNVEEILNKDNRFDLMRTWEDEHPGKNPFPDIFPEVIIAMIEGMDPDDHDGLFMEILELARGELLYG